MNKGFKVLIIVMLVSTVVASLWDKIPLIKNTSHILLDPTAGFLLNLNVNIGMIIISGILALLITLVQKYTVDQESLKKIKAEQKLLQEEMKKYKDHPEKLLELQKKQLEFLPQTMDLTMKPLVYTAVPMLLFFRWFNDYFAGTQIKIFGFFSWFWAYLIFSIIFSMIFRKVFKLP